jgi:hypothetical protein
MKMSWFLDEIARNDHVGYLAIKGRYLARKKKEKIIMNDDSGSSF